MPIVRSAADDEVGHVLADAGALGPRLGRGRWRRRWCRGCTPPASWTRAQTSRAASPGEPRSRRRSRAAARPKSSGGATSGGSARYSVHRSATSGSASSSQRAAGREAGGRSVCTVETAVTVIESCGSSTSNDGHVVAEVVAVVVGPRRRAHVQPRVHDDLAAAGQRRHPRLVVRRERLAVVLEAGRVDDAQLHQTRPPMPVACPRSRRSSGRVTASVASAQVRWSFSISPAGRPHVGERAVLQLGAGAADEPLRLVLEAGPLAGLEVVQALLGPVEREDHRPREEPVEQQELGRPALGLQALVGAQERLVAAARAQRARPRRADAARRRRGGDQPRGHVGALEARPSMRNCQPSSRVIVASAAPLISAARSRTQRKPARGPSGRTGRSRRCGAWC